jgi:hypothetical protein
LPARQRHLDIGTRRGQALLAELTREAERARLERGLSYSDIGRAMHLDRTQVARICRGRSPHLSVLRTAQLLAVVGLDLSARASPGGQPIRDIAQIALLRRFRSILGPDLKWRAEVPVIELPGSFDRRAWDAAIEGTGLVVRVEAETAVRDAQAVIRRIALKLRDGRVDRVLLVLADTKRNREAVAAATSEFDSLFPTSPRAALHDLRAGLAPAGNAVLFI